MAVVGCHAGMSCSRRPTVIPMNLKILMAGLMLLTMTLTIMPSADAVGTCTILDNANPSTPNCPALACIGTSWSYPDRYYRCQTAIDPCTSQCYYLP